MAININLNVIMAKKKIGLTELADKVGISLANLSILKNNRARAIRFSTLDAICKALDCQPGDLLEFIDSGDESDPAAGDKPGAALYAPAAPPVPAPDFPPEDTPKEE